MAITEAQTGSEAKAADSRFFIAAEHRTSGLVLELIANLDDIATTSAEARVKMQALTDDDHKAYTDSLSKLSGPDREAAAQVVGRIQSILEAAYRHNDAVAAIQKAGLQVAVHIRDTMPLGVQIINGNPYWISADRTGKRQLCGTDDTGEAYIIYGTVADQRREVGDEARLPDYIQLITDVESEMAAQSHS